MAATPSQELEIAEKEVEIKTPVKFRLQDPVYRRTILLWMCLPIGMFTTGIIDSQGGATLLDLQIITSTDEQVSGLYFTAYNLGYVLGSFIGGFCYDKINSYLLLTLCTIVAGGSAVACPYCSTFLLMFIIKCVTGTFLGIIGCIVSAEHMNIWGTRGESLLQLINCVYAVGAVVGPIMASPFIAELDRDNKTQSFENLTLGDLLSHNMTFNNSLFINMTCDEFINLNMTNYVNHNLTFDSLMINLTAECLNHTEGGIISDLPQTTNVHYSYLIAGIICELSAIPFLIVLLVSNKSDSKVETKGHSSDSNISNRKLPLMLKAVMSVLLFLYFFFYLSIEVTIDSYLLVFIVHHFDTINTHEADYVLTYYSTFFAIGRFISIFTSRYLTPARLLYIHLTMIAVALGGMLASASFSRFNILVVFSCLMGLACSALFPAAMSWTESELMKVTGPIASVMLVGASLGPMVTPYGVGYLMDYVSNMWFCYILILVFVLAVCILAILMTFNRCYVDKKYGQLGTVFLQEKLNDLPSVIVQATHM